MELLKYLEYTPTIAAIIGILVVVKLFVDFMKNHVQHNTRASEQLASAINQMLRFLERNKGG